MPLLYIDKVFDGFDAAHQLPQHDGKCKNLHGHTYKVACKIVGLMHGDIARPDFGMLIDFGHIKTVYKERIDSVCDHALLLGEHLPTWYVNSLVYHQHDRGISREEAMAAVDLEIGKVAHLPIPTTTAEHLAAWMFGEIREGLGKIHNATDKFYYTVQAVTVWETPSSSATVEHFWTEEELFRYSAAKLTDGGSR